MNRFSILAAWRDHTTVIVLLALCVVLSLLTLDRQSLGGAAGGRQVARQIAAREPAAATVLIIVRDTEEDAAFAAAVQQAGLNVADTVRGQPADARRAIGRLSSAGQTIDFIAANDVTARWGVLQDLPSQGASVKDAVVVVPRSYVWPTFLKLENLVNIANQIVIIAIIAIGMTMVIIAGGIDLSAGSVVALSAVVLARLVRDWPQVLAVVPGLGNAWAGGEATGLVALGVCIAATIALAALVGAFNGAFITLLRIPPFIVTLAMMSMASGLAFMVTSGETISDVPLSITGLMRGATLLRIPNGIVLMVLLYCAGHVVLARTVFGRYLYAVGGNRQAAWLCGLPVRRVELASYVICGALAGLGGVLMVSQYRSGAPNYGVTYELQVIAAVVVGGTSLAGGQGRMFGTLLGALLIAVVQNGMNLMNISSDPQKVVLGLVILAAAVLDRLKQGRRE